MKLSKWAQKQGISYITAYRWFKNGKIPNAHQTETGTILISDKEDDMLQRSSDILSMFDLTMFDPDFKWCTNIPKYESRFKTINEPNQYLVVGEVPGFKDDEIKISVQNNVIHISGSHEMTSNEHVFSRETSKFSVSYALPTDVNIDSISAEQEHGILRITIPKSESRKEIKEIPIQQPKQLKE